jgi:hypothetical protein
MSIKIIDASRKLRWYGASITKPDNTNGINDLRIWFRGYIKTTTLPTPFSPRAGLAFLSRGGSGTIQIGHPALNRNHAIWTFRLTGQATSHLIHRLQQPPGRAMATHTCSRCRGLCPQGGVLPIVHNPRHSRTRFTSRS